jgi:hypothetical protein
MSINEIMKSLQDPFPAADIEWRVGSTNKEKTKGLALAYVTNRAIQNRLDEVFGPFGWQNQFREWKGTSQLCGISINYNGEWITKWDGSDDSNTEATKGGLSDSMKRAAYQWGIGRYLYKIPQTWVPLKDGKYLSYTPNLPDWALPENERGKVDYRNGADKPTPISSKQVSLIKVRIKELEQLGGAEEGIFNALRVKVGDFNQLTDMTAQQASKSIEWLNAWKEKKEEEKKGA